MKSYEITVGAKPNDCCVYKGKEDVWTRRHTVGRNPGGNTGRSRSDFSATLREANDASNSEVWRRWDDRSLELSEEASPASTLSLNFQPPEPERRKLRSL